MHIVLSFHNSQSLNQFDIGNCCSFRLNVYFHFLINYHHCLRVRVATLRRCALLSTDHRVSLCQDLHDLLSKDHRRADYSNPYSYEPCLPGDLDHSVSSTHHFTSFCFSDFEVNNRFISYETAISSWALINNTNNID